MTSIMPRNRDFCRICAADVQVETLCFLEQWATGPREILQYLVSVKFNLHDRRETVHENVYFVN